jgi:hypothetical protein
LPLPRSVKFQKAALPIVAPPRFYFRGWYNIMADSPLHLELREEIKTLKKRMITLETAEAEKEKLRKELSHAKKQMDEEKARMELVFMNQVSTISQANALKVEEMEGQLRESNAVNRALNEQLENLTSFEKKMQDMEMRQEKEIARIVDRKMEEIDEVKQELDIVKYSKDEMAVKLGEAQTRVMAERRKVQELNTSLEELNASILNDSQIEKGKIDTLEAQLLSAELENDKLKNELYAALDNEKTCSIKQVEAVRTIREKLRARDFELNTKIEEMRQLEMMLQDALLQSASKVELENANIRLGNDLKDAIGTRSERDLVISRLENDNRRLNCDMVSLEQENKDLLANLQECMKHGSLDKMADREDAFAKLQSEYGSLKQSHSKLKTEIVEMKAALRRETDRRVSSDIGVPQRENSSGAGNRASKIIQQLEKNLKRESQCKKAATLAMKNKHTVETTNDFKVQSLTAELNTVKLQLDSERDIVKKLRKELKEVKDQRVFSRHSCAAYSGGVRVDVGSIDTGTAVKGIVRTIEQRLDADDSKRKESKPVRRVIGIAKELPGVTGDLEDPGEEICHDRQQVAELEGELTRQCEINCALLKEISDLSRENDAFRKVSLQANGIVNNTRNGDDQNEIDRLIVEVARVKSQLFNAEHSKASLEERYDILTAKHKKEVDAFKQQLELAEEATRNVTTRMDESSSIDKHEIESLQKSLKEIKGELSKSKDLLTDLQNQSCKRAEICENLETLQAELSNAERCRESLSLEKQSLESEILHLKTVNQNVEQKQTDQQLRFDVLQDTVNKKVQEFEQLRSDHIEEIRRLRGQVTSLEQELTETRDKAEQLNKTLQERKDIESTVDELARKNVQKLHAQINTLQKELTRRQVKVSEIEIEAKRKISALEEAIDAAQMEMEESVCEKEKTIEDLKRAIEEKDRKAMLLEKEKEQLVLSVNDMMKSRRDEIDDLQKELMEMSTRSANGTREVQMLKLQIQESGYRKEEMDRLRARVTELGDLLTGRRERSGSDSSSLEIENSELRKKLRDAVAERQAAEDKLRDYVTEKGGSKQVQVLRDRNAALKHEVEKLTKKMRKLTESFQPESPQSHDQNKKHQQNQSVDQAAVEATRFVI